MAKEVLEKAWIFFLLVLCASLTSAQNRVVAQKIVVTVLTTNVADMAGHGEWSCAAWVEVDGRAFLFDTGWSPRNVFLNAEALGIDLSAAEDLILSHHHADHTGGLETLGRELKKRNPKALSRIHAAKGIFSPRPRPDGTEGNPMIALRERLEKLGSTFIIHDGAVKIADGVWVSGPVPRTHDERNYPSGPERLMELAGRIVPDTDPESQSLVILAEDGPIVVSGCGHAGLINTREHIQEKISTEAPQAAIGGFHLFAATDDVLEWTAASLEKLSLGHFLGSHCTGFESVFRIRELANMTRDSARVGAIGTRYITGRGIIPGRINR